MKWAFLHDGTPQEQFMEYTYTFFFEYVRRYIESRLVLKKATSRWFCKHIDVFYCFTGLKQQINQHFTHCTFQALEQFWICLSLVLILFQRSNKVLWGCITNTNCTKVQSLRVFKIAVTHYGLFLHHSRPSLFLLVWTAVDVRLCWLSTFYS